MVEVQKIEEGNDFISVTNEKQQSFKIGYWGCDLYWTMKDYAKNNLFVVTKEDILFYSFMNTLFSKIEEYDNPYDKCLEDNRFEWKSEAEGLLENAHQLVITKMDDCYTIQFLKNLNKFLMGNVCSICFCLSGSRNEQIASTFSLMSMKLRDNFSKQNQMRVLVK